MNDVMKFINSFGRVMGLEFKDERKPNLRFAFACLLNFTVWPIELHSVITLFPSRDIIILLGIFAFNITVWTKLLFINANHKRYMSLVNFILKVVKINALGPRESIFVDTAKKIRSHFKTNLFSFLAGIAIFSTYPCYDLIFNGNFTLVSPAVMPIINADSLHGYFINSAFNLFMVCYCLTACISISSLFFASVDAYDGLVSLIEDDFGQFDLMCDDSKHVRVNVGVFRNIMTGLTDLARLNSYVNDMFGTIATVQIAMSCLVVVIFVGACLAFDYVAGIGAAITFYTEMWMYCFMGQLLDNSNQRIVTVICDAKWYTYEVKHQKDLITALYITQNLKPVCIANVAPLNFDTGLKITNNIYSFTMFMLNMFA